MKPLVTLLGYIAAIVAGPTAHGAQVPECLANGRALAVNDADVEHWEDTTASHFQGRAHIVGKVIGFFPDQTGHNHFSVQIGATGEDAIELIYNQSFGRLPVLAVGMTVEACGDYITDLASPDKAIIHWVHKSNSASHASGYVAIDGEVYGQDL